MSRQFREWITLYQDQVWSLARYLLADAAEAEDVAQEAFLRLWQNQASIDGDGTRPWLLAVTRNLCLDRLRRKPGLEAIEDTPGPEDSGPRDVLDQAQLADRLRTAIEGLGEPYRSLVVLRDMQQNSYADIGTIMALSPEQVKVYLHRARLQLRETLYEVRP